MAAWYTLWNYFNYSTLHFNSNFVVTEDIITYVKKYMKNFSWLYSCSAIYIWCLDMGLILWWLVSLIDIMFCITGIAQILVRMRQKCWSMLQTILRPQSQSSSWNCSRALNWKSCTKTTIGASTFRRSVMSIHMFFLLHLLTYITQVPWIGILFLKQDTSLTCWFSSFFWIPFILSSLSPFPCVSCCIYSVYACTVFSRFTNDGDVISTACDVERACVNQAKSCWGSEAASSAKQPLKSY